MKLYQYQEDYLAKLPPSCIMAADLGTGKTLMSLAHWDRQQTGRRLLVVAPAAKIRTEDWNHEAKRYFTSIGARSNYDYDGMITYISYESLRLMDTKTKRPRHWQYTGARNGGVIYDVIADECHALKNPTSKQSKAILEIVKSGGLFIGLSGTPLPNGWIDFAGYSKIFGFTKGVTEFKRRYCVYQTFKGFPELLRYVNTDELESQLAACAYYLGRESANDLPSRKMIGVNIRMDTKTAKLYTEIRLKRKDPRTGEVLEEPSRASSLLRQLTANSRLDNLVSIVNDTSDNVVIFYNYVSERNAILKALKDSDKTILRYDGDQHDTLPKSDALLHDTVLLAHYKSASTGLNLQWANVTIYFSPTYSYQEFEQSVGRTHRTHQKKKCLYYLFNVQGTIDRDVWECLRAKRSFNDTLWESVS